MRIIRLKREGGSIYFTWTRNGVYNSTFVKNRAEYGGGVYNYKGKNNVIDNSSFIQNSAITGGGVYYKDEGKSVINNSLFIENDADYGAGVYYIDNETEGIVNNSVFIRNYARNGSIIYGGNEYNCSIIKIMPNIFLTPLTCFYNEVQYLNILLKGHMDLPIANASVFVEIIGVMNAVETTNVGGEINLLIKDLLPGSYKIVLSFEGDDNYNGTVLYQDFIVNKIPVKIIANKKKFKLKNKHKKYSVILKDHEGNPIKNVKVRLIVKKMGKKSKNDKQNKGKHNKKVKSNKKRNIVKTNNQGKATFKLKKINKKGKYMATVKYYGDVYFNKSIQKAKLIIK